VAEEIWLPVVGYENAYSVSDRGRVRPEARVVLRNGIEHRVRERLLKPCRRPDGILKVGLSAGGRSRRYCAHVLAREAFGAERSARWRSGPRPREGH